MGQEPQYHAPHEYYTCRHPFSIKAKINGKCPEYLLTYERTHEEQHDEEKLSIQYVTTIYTRMILPLPNNQAKNLVIVDGKPLSHPDREKISAYDLDALIVQGLNAIPCNNAQRFLKTHIPGYAQFQLDHSRAEAIKNTSGSYALIAETKNNMQQYIVFFENDGLTMLRNISAKLEHEHPGIRFQFIPAKAKDFDEVVHRHADKIKQKKAHVLFGPNGTKG